MVQNTKVSGTATKVIKGDNGHVSVRYHNTIVAEKNVRDGRAYVTLNSGGFLTATTKLRMNQFAAEFCYGSFGIHQKDGVWYITTKSTGSVCEFEDNMELFSHFERHE